MTAHRRYGDNDAKRDTGAFTSSRNLTRSGWIRRGKSRRPRPTACAFATRTVSRDCESVAVDAIEGTIYLLIKREALPRLIAFRSAPRVKNRLSRNSSALFPSSLKLASRRVVQTRRGKRAAWPTGLDIHGWPDGRRAYAWSAGRFVRQGKESWAESSSVILFA